MLAFGSVIFGTTIDPGPDFTGGAAVAAGFGDAVAILICRNIPVFLAIIVRSLVYASK